ncbi:MAG: hypothetical protein ACO394_08575, partial [Blastocatellia bacterium]
VTRVNGGWAMGFRPGRFSVMEKSMMIVRHRTMAVAPPRKAGREVRRAQLIDPTIAALATVLAGILFYLFARRTGWLEPPASGRLPD